MSFYIHFVLKKKFVSWQLRKRIRDKKFAKEILTGSKYTGVFVWNNFEERTWNKKRRLIGVREEKDTDNSWGEGRDLSMGCKKGSFRYKKGVRRWETMILSRGEKKGLVWSLMQGKTEKCESKKPTSMFLNCKTFWNSHHNNWMQKRHKVSQSEPQGSVSNGGGINSLGLQKLVSDILVSSTAIFTASTQTSHASIQRAKVSWNICVVEGSF